MGAAPWYAQPDGRHEFAVSNDVEFVRLMTAAGNAGVPIWLLARAAEVIVDRRGCELREAWDRLAFNLEAFVAGRIWVSVWRDIIDDVHVHHDRALFDALNAAAR